MAGQKLSAISWAFTCCMPHKLIAKVSDRLEALRVYPADERSAQRITLRLLHDERIGWERRAVDLVWRKCAGAKVDEPHLGDIVAAIQQIFVKHHFLSFENAVGSDSWLLGYYINNGKKQNL